MCGVLGTGMFPVSRLGAGLSYCWLWPEEGSLGAFCYALQPVSGASPAQRWAPVSLYPNSAPCPTIRVRV